MGSTALKVLRTFFSLITCKNSEERRFHTGFPLEYSVPIPSPVYYTGSPMRNHRKEKAGFCSLECTRKQ